MKRLAAAFALVVLLTGTACEPAVSPEIMGSVEGRVEFFVDVGYGPTHLLYPDRNIELLIEERAVSITTGGWFRMDSVRVGTHEMTAAPSVAVVPASCRGLRELPPETVTLTIRENTMATANFALNASHLNGRCFAQYRN